MNKLFGTFLLAVMMLPTLAQAESRESMKGTTLSEREIRWGWKYLKEVANSCLASKTECQDPEIRKIVQSLDAYLPSYDSKQAKQWAELLSFISEKDHPGVFTSNHGEVHRLAITQLKPFSTVMINTDQMSRPLKDWIGILAHEAVHHLGFEDDEKRLPDLVGSELAAHFMKRALESKLDQFNRTDARSLIFNSNGTRQTVGFFSANEGTFDIEWGTTKLTPVCFPNEVVTREFVGNPNWSINFLKVKTGVVTLRGGGFVNVMCQTTSGTPKETKRQMLLGAVVELKYSAPLNLKTWNQETPAIVIETTQLGPSMSPPDVMWGPNQSFWVQAINHEKSSLQAGDVWKTKVIVKSMDGYVPQTCEVYFSGLNWSFWKHVSLPAVAMFNGCVITKLDGDRYQLDVSYNFPADMQPDDFYIPLIRFPGFPGDRYAVPRLPSFVHVESKTHRAPAEIKSLEIKSLSTTQSMSGIRLTDSYKADDDQKFQVELFIQGDQQFSNVQVDLPMWTPAPGGIAHIFANGPVADFQEIFGNVSITKVPGGSKVSIEVKMIPSISGYPIMAMKFARILLATSDFSWVEIENTTETDGLVVNSKFAK